MSAKRATLVDYGSGNILSVARALQACGSDVELVNDAEGIRKAERLVLPGVGAFGDCITSFRDLGLEEPLKTFVSTGRPLIGLCVGMQMLFERSLEFGEHTGLGLLKGEVRPIPKTMSTGGPHKIPHIGWSALEMPLDEIKRDWSVTILRDILPGTEVYFVHSFAAWPENPHSRIADAKHGGRQIAAVVCKDNILGTQFHPEKSGKAGLAILNNFLAL